MRTMTKTNSTTGSTNMTVVVLVVVEADGL